MTLISNEEAKSLQDEFFGDDLREEAVLSSLEALLPGHDRFIDVGANIGQFSCYVNKYLHSATIISIEANPVLLPLLKNNISHSRSEYDHNNSFNILHNAVSDSNHELTFHVDPCATTSSIFGDGAVAISSDKRQAIQVAGIMLDELYVTNQKTFIKMDIEGAEYRALLGSSLFLKSRNTTFLIEVHPWGDPERRRYPLHLCALMCLNNYKMKKIVPHYFFGSHYVFVKSQSLISWGTFVYYFPVLFAEFFIYRFFGNNAEKITDALRSRFKRSKTKTNRTSVA